MPTATLHRPQKWSPVRRGLVDPKWRWAWDNMIVAILFDEGAGVSRELITRSQAILPDGWQMSPAGIGGQVDDANGRISFGGDTRWDATRNQFTLLAVWEDWGQVGSVGYPALIANTKDDNTAINYFLGTWVLTNEVYVVWYNAGYRDLLSGLNCTVNDVNVAIASVPVTGNIIFWVNGQIAEVARHASAIVTNADNKLTVGGPNVALSRSRAGIYNLAVAWDKYMPLAQIRALGADPFAPFQMIRPALGKAPAAVGGVAVRGWAQK